MTIQSAIVISETQRASSKTAGSKSLRNDSVRDQRANAMAMERNDEEQVDFSIDVMHRADGRDHDARRITLHCLQHRQPEVEVLVVATRDNFIFSDKENRPGPYLLTDAVLAPDGRLHDFSDSRSFQTEDLGRRVTHNQQNLHPERSVSEQRKEDVD